MEQLLENTSGKVGRSDCVLSDLTHFFELYKIILAFCVQIGHIMCYQDI